MDWEEELFRVVRNKFAPDIASALTNSPDYIYASLSELNNFVRVPMLACTKIVYDKGLAEFVITASMRENENQPFDNFKAIFSTRELNNTADRVAFVDYLFEGLKRKFISKILEGNVQQQLAKYQQPTNKE